MINYVEHKDIDLGKWDRSLKLRNNENICLESWFLSAVCDRWDALVGDDYETIMPLPINQKYGMDIIYQPFFCHELGVNGANTDLTLLLSEIPESVKHISLKVNNGLSLGGLKIEVTKHQMLELNDLELIRKGFNKNAKRNISKAKKNEVTCRFVRDYTEVIRLFKTVNKKGLKAFSEDHYDKLDELMLRAIEQGNGIIVEAVQDQKVVSACFFLLYSNTITYLKGASDEFGKELGAMHLIFDSLIEEYISDFDLLHFGGSNVESVAGFYKNFGGVDDESSSVTIDRMPPLLGALKKIKHKYWNRY